MKRFENVSELDGPDRELADALYTLDPASSDPNYWLRFRVWILRGAARELARRRLLARLTVSDVLRSWARTVVPTAVLAAVLAGVLLIRGGSLRAPEPLGIEELLTSEIEDEMLPMLAPSAADEPITFAAEVF